MDPTPFLLVIVSAVTHGLWNFLAKRATQKDLFIGLSKAAETLIFAGPFIFLVARNGYGERYWMLYVGVAACFVFLNYAFLAQAYRRAELSVAYPISRASTLYLPLLAFLFIGERIDAVGWLSITCITCAVLVMQLEEFSRREVRTLLAKLRRPGIVFALLAALMAASYTIWDEVAVARIHPFSLLL